MDINKAAKKILKALSFEEIDVEKSRQLADLKRLDPMKIFYRTVDTRIYNGDHLVPVRLFFPDEKTFQEEKIENGKELLMFYHQIKLLLML